jgi:hypothetical protein
VGAAHPTRSGNWQELESSINPLCDGLFCCFERVLASSTDGASPIVGKFLEGSSGGDIIVGIPFLGIVNVAAGSASVGCHGLALSCWVFESITVLTLLSLIFSDILNFFADFCDGSLSASFVSSWLGFWVAFSVRSKRQNRSLSL